MALPPRPIHIVMPIPSAPTTTSTAPTHHNAPQLRDHFIKLAVCPEHVRRRIHDVPQKINRRNPPPLLRLGKPNSTTYQTPFLRSPFKFSPGISMRCKRRHTGDFHPVAVCTNLACCWTQKTNPAMILPLPPAPHHHHHVPPKTRPACPTPPSPCPTQNQTTH